MLAAALPPASFVHVVYVYGCVHVSSVYTRGSVLVCGPVEIILLFSMLPVFKFFFYVICVCWHVCACVGA